MKLSLETAQVLFDHFMGEHSYTPLTLTGDVLRCGALRSADDTNGSAVAWMIAVTRFSHTSYGTLVAGIQAAIDDWLVAKPGDLVTENNIRVGMVFEISGDKYTVRALGRCRKNILGWDLFSVEEGPARVLVSRYVGACIVSLGQVAPAPVETPEGDFITAKNAAPGVQFRNGPTTYTLVKMRGGGAWDVRFKDAHGCGDSIWNFELPPAVRMLVQKEPQVAPPPPPPQPEPFGWVDAPPDPPKKDPKDRLRCKCHGYLKCTVRDYEESQAMMSSRDLNNMAMTVRDHDNPRKSSKEKTALEMLYEMFAQGQHRSVHPLELKKVAEVLEREMSRVIYAPDDSGYKRLGSEIWARQKRLKAF